MLRSRRSVTLAVALAGLPLLLGLSGCSGVGESATSSAQPMSGVAGGVQASGAPAGANESVVAAPAADQASSGQAKGADGKAAGSDPAALVGVQLIRTADIVLQVDHLDTSAARVRAVAQSVGGTVSSEVTTFPDSPTSTTQQGTEGSPDAGTTVRSTRPGESVIVLRVPVASLDQALERVTAVGTVLSRTSTSQDVTADLADVGSRVKTQQASVERVRQLLAKANSLQDIVTLEAELTRRQSDLEALEARRASLADRAALSTLTVTLRTPTVTEQVDTSNGFTAGLRRGWQAVIASTTVVLTLLGALLPLIVLAAVVGIPLTWWIRRRRASRTRPPVPPAPPAPGTTAATPPPPPPQTGAPTGRQTAPPPKQDPAP
jgi:hypothetical protein